MHMIQNSKVTTGYLVNTLPVSLALWFVSGSCGSFQSYFQGTYF